MKKTALFALPLVMALSISTSALAWDLGVVGKFAFEKITGSVHVMHGPRAEPSKANHGFMNNPGIIVSKTGIIVVDPGGTYQVGKKIIEEVAKVSKLPIIAVFNTHIHGDHWLGNQAIQEAFPKAKMYGHPAMIEQANGENGASWIALMEKLTEGLSKGTKIVAPTLETKKDAVIEIDGQHFKIHYNPSESGRAHTNTDIMVEHVESKTLFLGDNCFLARMGRFDGSSEMHGNIEALKLAEDLKLDHYVPGHGKSGSAKEVVAPFKAYLELMQKEVSKGFAAEKQDYEIRKAIFDKFSSYSHWTGFKSNFGKHISKMYSEVEEREF